MLWNIWATTEMWDSRIRAKTIRLPKKKLKQVTTAPPNSATFRLPITPYRENSKVDSRASATPVMFSLVFHGLIMTTVPRISRAKAAICRGLIGSFSRKKAKKVTNTGLQLNITAATEELV